MKICVIVIVSASVSRFDHKKKSATEFPNIFQNAIFSIHLHKTARIKWNSDTKYVLTIMSIPWHYKDLKISINFNLFSFDR